MSLFGWVSETIQGGMRTVRRGRLGETGAVFSEEQVYDVEATETQPIPAGTYRVICGDLYRVEPGLPLGSDDKRENG